MNPDTDLEKAKNILEIVAIFVAWGIGVFSWANRQSKSRAKAIEAKLRAEVNGVGSQVNALNITVGQHEGAMDRLESDARLARQVAETTSKALGELKTEVSKVWESLEKKDEISAKAMTEILVAVGKLDTKVEILLNRERSQ